MICTSRIFIRHKVARNTRNYKRASNWWGFWLTPEDKILKGMESHQNILDTNEGPKSYSDAFNHGWIRGYIQAGEAGIEARSLVGDIFKKVQNLLREESKRFLIRDVYIDLNDRSYDVPLDTFLEMSNSGEIKPFQSR